MGEGDSPPTHTRFLKRKNMNSKTIAHKIAARKINSAFVETLAVLDLKLSDKQTDEVLKILEDSRK